MKTLTAVHNNRKNRLQRIARGSKTYSYSQSGSALTVSVPTVSGGRYQWFAGNMLLIGQTFNSFVSSSPMTTPIRCRVSVGETYEFYQFIRKPRNPLFLGSKLLGFINGKDASKMTLSTNKVSNLVDSYFSGVSYSQATDTNRPLLTSEGLFFDDSNDFLSYTLNSNSLYNVTGGIHVFCFSKITNTEGGGGDLWFGEASTSSSTMNYYMIGRNSTSGGTPSFRNKLGAQIRNSGTFYLGQSSTRSDNDAFTTTFNCQEMEDRKGAGYYSWINGIADKVNVQDTTARSGFTWAGNVRTIGANQNSTVGSYFGGVLAHIVVVKASEITEAEMQEIRAWGMQDCGVLYKLKNTNPYA